MKTWIHSVWNISLVLLISRSLAKLSTIGVIILTARILGVEDFGLFNSVLALSMFAGIISDFGLVLPGIRSISRSDDFDASFVRHSIGFRAFLGIIACLGIMIAGLFLDLSVNIIAMLCIASVFEVNGIAFIRSFEGINAFKIVSVYTVVERALFGIFSIVSLLVFAHVEALVVSILVAQAVFFLIALRIFSKRFGKPSIDITRKKMAYYLRLGIPFFMITVFSTFYYRIDIVLISHFVSLHDSGIYNAAMRIVDAQMMIPLSVMTIVFPLLSALYGKQTDRFIAVFKKYFLIMMLVGIALSLLTLLSANSIVTILYSEKFKHSAEILRILSLMLVVFSINALLFQTLVAMHKEVVFTYIMLASAVISLAGNTIFLQMYGMIAAAWVRVAIELITCVFGIVYIYSHLHRHRVNTLTVHNPHDLKMV